MPFYKILANPGHNRVYFNESRNLALRELAFSSAHMDAGIEDISQDTICGVYYITFKSKQHLSDMDLRRIGGLSFAYAAFEDRDGLFCPVPLVFPAYMREDINTILKYSGKTNELFTRLMVNMALYASHFAGEAFHNLTLLDPLCGKGTTLFEGLARGYDVIGVEVLANAAHDAEVFLLRYLKEGRFIHKALHEKRSNTGGKKIATCTKIQLAPTRDTFESQPRNVTLFTADTRLTVPLCKKSSAHLLVADLPYGVQHGSLNSVSMARNPSELLRESLPAWVAALKTGGAMALAYNVNVTTVDEMRTLVENAGMQVVDVDLIHRVDQSILRNIIVAVKE